MIVSFSKEHPVKKLESNDVQAVEREPFNLTKGIYQAQVEVIFKQAKTPPTIRFEIHDCNTIANRIQEHPVITTSPEAFLISNPKICLNIQVNRLTLCGTSLPFDSNTYLEEKYGYHLLDRTTDYFTSIGG